MFETILSWVLEALVGGLGLGLVLMKMQLDKAVAKIEEVNGKLDEIKEFHIKRSISFDNYVKAFDKKEARDVEGRKVIIEKIEKVLDRK